MRYVVTRSIVPGVFLGRALEIDLVSQGRTPVEALVATMDAARLFVTHRALSGRPVQSDISLDPEPA